MMRCRIRPTADRQSRRTLALTMRADGHSYSAIAAATGYTRRHVIRLVAEAFEEWLNRHELASAA